MTSYRLRNSELGDEMSFGLLGSQRSCSPMRFLVKKKRKNKKSSLGSSVEFCKVILHFAL